MRWTGRAGAAPDPCPAQTVCQTTLSEEMRVKVAALQCLNKIMDDYYGYMEQYMSAALYGVRLACVAPAPCCGVFVHLLLLASS